MTCASRRLAPSLLAAGVAALGTLGGLLSAPAQTAPAAAVPVDNLTPPKVTGKPVFRSPLVASPGTWEPSGTTYTFQWLRAGKPIPGARKKRYVPVVKDLGRNLKVRVTASHPDRDPASAVSAPVRVRLAPLVPRRKPIITGTNRYTHTLRADQGRWRVKPRRVAFQWLRNGKPIKGATGRRYRLSHLDVGKKVRVRVRAGKPGHKVRANLSKPKRILHRVKQRHLVRYSVETRGRLNASVKKFRRLANNTLNDPRGWRGAAGIAFTEVKSSNAMRLVLAEASTVPGFSSGCSATWSCRVGRYVIINQTRWRQASPAWKQRGGSLRAYRHMVVNHETGHWLGWGHRSCPRAGAKAPLMQQQSISLQGCKLNPWPKPAERNVPRF